MTRFFYDIANETSRTYDYHGRFFSTADEAFEMAEIVAYDLACSEKDNWAGFEIQVRNVANEILFSFPIEPSEKVFS